MGLHAGLGSQYLLNQCIDHVQKDDVVVLAFEYEHFYRNYHLSSNELLRSVVEVMPEHKKYLSLKQKVGLVSFLPRFSISKLQPSSYKKRSGDPVYSSEAFNEFGDLDAHWGLETRGYKPKDITGKLQKDVLEALKKFETEAEKKGAKVFVSFPSLTESVFMENQEKVETVEKKYSEYDFEVLGTSTRYRMPMDLMFDSHYHLIKEGVDRRTNLLIQDLQAALN